jgi:hypothetical protein
MVAAKWKYFGIFCAGVSVMFGISYYKSVYKEACVEKVENEMKRYIEMKNKKEEEMKN